jgi:hypothetical protein
VSALPAYLADEPDCNCLLFEEHLERCPGRPALPLPDEVPVVTYRDRPRGRSRLAEVLADPVIVAPASKLRLVLALREWPERSANQIAEQVGCDRRYVDRLRHEQVGTSPILPARVTGRDGKSYSVDTPKGISIADTPCAAPVTIAHTPEPDDWPEDPEPVLQQEPERKPEPEQEQGEPVPLRAHDHKRRVAAALDRYAARMARRGAR